MSDSETVDPQDFAEAEPSNTISSDGDEGGASPSLDLSGLPEPVQSAAKPVGRAMMRTGSAPDAAMIRDEYGIPEWSAYMVRGTMRALPVDGDMTDPPAGGDFFIGFIKLLTGNQTDASK